MVNIDYGIRVAAKLVRILSYLLLFIGDHSECSLINSLISSRKAG